MLITVNVFFSYKLVKIILFLYNWYRDFYMQPLTSNKSIVSDLTL